MGHFMRFVLGLLCVCVLALTGPSYSAAVCGTYLEDWSTTVGSAGGFPNQYYSPLAIQPDTTGQTYVLSRTQIGATYLYNVTKFSALGDSLWRFDVPESTTVDYQCKVDRDGNLVVSYLATFSPLEKFIKLHKIRPNGVVAWSKEIPALGKNVASLKAIDIAPNGDVVVGGTLVDSSLTYANGTVWAMRIDSAGTYKSMVLPDVSPDSLTTYQVKLVATDDMFFFATMYRCETAISFEFRHKLILFGENGDLVWSVDGMEPGDDQLIGTSVGDLAIDEAGLLYWSFETYSGGSFNARYRCVDVTGDLVWTLNRPGKTLRNLKLHPDKAGNLYTVNNFGSFGAGFLKIGPDGSIVHEVNYDSVYAGRPGYSVALSSGEIIVVPNYLNPIVAFDTTGAIAWKSQRPASTLDVNTQPLTRDRFDNLYFTTTQQPGVAARQLRLTKLVPGDGPFIFQDAQGEPLRNVAIDCYRITTTAPNWDAQSLGTFVTSECGTIVDLQPLLAEGDILRAEIRLHDEPAVKHEDILGTMFTVWLDNASFDSLGAMKYHTVSDAGRQVVKLGHTTVRWNLVVSIEWDAFEPYIQSTERGFRAMANYMYDVFNGQVMFDTIMIFDDAVRWDDADIRVHASNMEWPRANLGGVNATGSSILPSTVYLPRQFFGHTDLNRLKSYLDDPLEVDATSDYRTRGHELGHYLLGFWDEYSFPIGSRCPQVTNYGYMDSHYPESGPWSSELSTLARYEIDPQCQNTDHWYARHKSCWDHFENQFEGRWGQDSIFAPIVVPSEVGPADPWFYVVGPNEDMGAPDHDIGARIAFPVAHSAPNARTIDLSVGFSLRSYANVAITLEQLFGANPRDIPQGNLTNDGKMKVLGARAGDKISGFGVLSTFVGGQQRAGRVSGRQWVSGTASIDSLVFFSSAGSGAAGDPNQLVLNLTELQGDYAFIPLLIHDSQTTSLQLQTNNLIGQLPTAELAADSGSFGVDSLSVLSGGYAAFWSAPLPGSGAITLTALDDSTNSYFVPLSFKGIDLNPSVLETELFNADGTAEIVLDSGSTSALKLALLTSPFPVLRNGLNETNLQSGPAHGIFLYPDQPLTGINSLHLRYAESDLGDSADAAMLAPSLRVFRWNESEREWTHIGGAVDTALKQVSADITQSGVYALFTTQTPVDVEDDIRGDLLPNGLELRQNYPNPFNPITEIGFSLPKASHVILEIFNLTGQRVTTLVNSHKAAGIHVVQWDASQYASGVYMYRLTAGGFVDTKKMLLIK